MPDDFAAALARARDLVRAGKPHEATRLIQATLAKAPSAETPALETKPDRPPKASRIDPSGLPDAQIVTPRSTRPRRPLGQVVGDLAKAAAKAPRPPKSARTPALPADASFDWHSLSTAHGSRDYRLYLPAALKEDPTKGPQGLVLMLHGCTQDPDDFAAGTRMNIHAEQSGLIVAYPAQTRTHNASACWNWFRPADQMRDSGEAALLATLARDIAARHGVPSGRIFAAGLSAGGAMAAILGRAYPDVFAAIGVHSGLAAGSANDVVSAFAAMRGDNQPSGPVTRAPRTITFHGTADSTVHPANSSRIMAEARHSGHETLVTTGLANGRRFTRSQTLAPDGTPLTEHHEIEGTGHAWSGGSAAGSYTDPSGPDATALMLRFFLGGT